MLDATLAAVLAARDCPATRNLCGDARVWAALHGDAAGVAFAEMILAGVRAYVAHDAAMRRSQYAIAEKPTRKAA